MELYLDEEVIGCMLSGIVDPERLWASCLEHASLVGRDLVVPRGAVLTKIEGLSTVCAVEVPLCLVDVFEAFIAVPTRNRCERVQLFLCLLFGRVAAQDLVGKASQHLSLARRIAE